MPPLAASAKSASKRDWLTFEPNLLRRPCSWMVSTDGSSTGWHSAVVLAPLASGGEIEHAYNLCSNMRKLTQGKQTRKLLTPLFEAIASKSKIKKYYEVLDRTTKLGDTHGNFMLCYDKRTRKYSVRQRIRDGSNGKIVFVTVCSATTFKEARDWMIDKSIEKVQY